MRFQLFRLCASAAGLCVALLMPAGCVEISGQRLAISHDAERDSLTAFLFYDGVYDNPGRWEGKDGPTQLREFVAGGEVLLFDWPFHFAPDELRDVTEDEDQPDGLRELAAVWLESVTVEPVGWHRDAHGRIGGVQRAIVSNASRFVGALNRALDTLILESADDSTRTAQWLRAAAERGHEWLRLEGGAVHIHVPVHPGDGAMALAAAMRGESVMGEAAFLPRIIANAMLGSAHASATLTDAGLHMTAKGHGEATMLRLWIPERAYLPNLEDVVQDVAPRDLAAHILAHMRNETDDQATADLLAMAPREFILMAIVHRFEGADAAERAELRRLARDFTTPWAVHSPVPLPPDQPDDVLWLDESRRWCARMELFPLSAVE
jgi:hypothetical protein